MDRDNEALRRRMTGTAGDPAESEESAADETNVVREGVTRAIDPDELELRRQRGQTEDDTAARVDADIAGFDPDHELARPADFPESLDVATVAPDGTTVPNGTSQLTDPLTGEAIGGGRSVSDSVKAGLGGLGGDALDRGLDYDPLTPGTQDSGPGGQETTGDPSVDRAIMGRDGSLYSADGAPPAPGGTGPAPVDQELKDEIQMLIEEEEYDPAGAREEAKRRVSRQEEEYENPDADSGDNVTNLERVTVMRGSQMQPSNNPDDPVTGEVSTDNWIPPEDLVSRPAQEGDVEATTLTSAVTLGSSPVTNPTDPVLGDDGIITGGTSSGSGGSGGGDTIDSTTAMGTGAASSLGEGDANAGQKVDANNVSVDMATGQIVGDATGASDTLGPPPDVQASPAMGDETEPGLPPDGES